MEAVRRFLKRNPVFPYVMDALERAKSSRVRRELLADYHRLGKELAFFRGMSLADGQEKRVLVASITPFLYQVKQEGMLLIGLAMRGWRPIILTSRRYIWPQRYFKLFGFYDLIFWEDFDLCPKERSRCYAAARGYVRESFTFQRIKRWEYSGSWIGPQVISSVVRRHHLGLADFESRKVRGQILRELPRALEATVKADRILESVDPQMVLLNEVNGSIFGSITDLSVRSGRNVIQFVQPSRDDALIFKRITQDTRRTHPNSISLQGLRTLSACEWTSVREAELRKEFEDRYAGRWFLQSRNQPGVQRQCKEEIIVQLNIDSRKKIAVIFSHVLWDANLFYGDDLFEDYGDWFVQTVRAACDNDRVEWIVKLHPSNLWKRARDKVVGELAEMRLIARYIGELPRHVRCLHPDTKVSTLSLFESIDYGITVRGTVGMELPCFGIPTFTAGSGRYSGLGFTIDSASKEEYLARLAKIQETSPMTASQVDLARRHAWGVFKCRPWVMRSFRATFKYAKKGSHPLDHQLRPEAKSIDEMRVNGDLDRWASWAEKVAEVDYLEGM